MSAVLQQQLNLLENTDDQLWEKVVTKDRASDGRFVFAVATTGVYCRPSCPSRRPRRENVSFFRLPEAAERGGFRACLRCNPQDATPKDPHVEMARRVCRLIDQSNGDPLTLAELSEQVGVSSFHLQRTFKSVMGITPARYAETSRIDRFKQNVRDGQPVTNAIYEAGYGSSSRLYESAVASLGMTPATYGKGGRGVSINYTIADCELGKLLVASTEKGICAVKLGDTEADLVADLRREFSAADIQESSNETSQSVSAILEGLRKATHPNLPLDIRATAFQKQVWEHLRAIPFGETRSYAELAEAIGKPTATRAVARACATNPVAVVIPCHRVIREDKSLGGYRWGLERKRKLLQNEKLRKD